MKKRIFQRAAAALAVAATVLSLGGGTAAKAASEPPEEAMLREDASYIFTQLPKTFSFSSGAGAWSTTLTMGEDGAFTGYFSDTDTDGGDGYDATVRECTFSGQFGGAERIDDYTVSVTLEKLETERPAGEERIDSAQHLRYIEAEPYGLEKGTAFTVYLPGAPASGLPEEFMRWVSAPMGWNDKFPSELPFYGLYSETGQYGFFTSEEESTAPWHQGYADFLSGRKYLEMGQNYGTECDVLVGLHDMNGDGVPELIVGNGYEGRSTRSAYIYTWDGGMKYLGDGPSEAYCGTDPSFPGLFGRYGAGDQEMWSYYDSLSGQITVEAVCTGEKFGDLSAAQRITSDDALYQAFLGEFRQVKLYTAVAGDKLAALFKQPATEYSNDLAVAAAQLSYDAENTTADKVKERYRSLGITGETYDDYSGDKAYSIASGKMKLDGTETNLLVITARGSMTFTEFAGDFATGASHEFLGYTAHDLVYDFEENIMKGLNVYLDDHPELKTGNLKILITGHSLGGAAANLVAARFTNFTDSGAWWSGMLTKDDIYAYTFGAIDSIVTDTPVTADYENIHNVYNFYDSFGPNEYGKGLVSGVGTIKGKFGHIDLFSKQYRTDYSLKIDATNHIMPSYLDALDSGLVKCVNAAAPKKQTWVRLTCPVDVELLRDGETVGLIRDNTVVTEDPDAPMNVTDDVKDLLLDGTGTYTLRITATADGTMTCLAQEMDAAGEKLFQNVALTEGKTFVWKMEQGTEQSRLLVTDKNGNTIAEVQADGTEVPAETEAETEAVKETKPERSGVKLSAALIAMLAVLAAGGIIAAVYAARKKRKK